MRNEQPVRRRKTDTERQRNTVPNKKVRRNSGNRSASVKEQKQEPQRRAQASSSAARKRKAARIRQMRRKKIIRTFLLVLLIAALLAGAGAAVFMIKKTFPGTGTKVQRFRRILRFPDSRFRGKGGWFCGRSVCGFRRHSSGYCSSGRRSGRTSPGYQKQTGIVFQRSL